MNKLGLLILAVGLAACGDDGGGDDDAPAIDAAAGTIDSAPGTPDADTTDATPVVPDAAGPVNAACSALPLTLSRTFNAGFRYDYGVICFNPPGGPDAEDCQIKEGLYQLPASAGCSFGGIMIAEFGPGAGAVGGVLDFYFGFGSMVNSTSAGSANQNNINAIPDGPVTVDFQGSFNTGAVTSTVYRVVMTYNADDTVTVTSIGVMP